MYVQIVFFSPPVHVTSMFMQDSDESNDREIREEALAIAKAIREDTNRQDAEHFLNALTNNSSYEDVFSPTPTSAAVGKDDLDDLPPEMPPEQRELISREISMFRERSAAKDRQKREEEERRMMERDYGDRRGEMDRGMRMRPVHDHSYGGYHNRHGGPRGSMGHHGYHGYHSHQPYSRKRPTNDREVDEEEEEHRQKRRESEAKQAYLDVSR